jgi:uncharacterized protein
MQRGMMNQKIGRNDPCPCGSGKKYKVCCMQKSQPKPISLKGRVSVKMLNSNLMQQQTAEMEAAQAKAAKDYETLMERSFGAALQSEDEKPPAIAPEYFEPSEETSKEQNEK